MDDVTPKPEPSPNPNPEPKTEPGSGPDLRSLNESIQKLESALSKEREARKQAEGKAKELSKQAEGAKTAEDRLASLEQRLAKADMDLKVRKAVESKLDGTIDPAKAFALLDKISITDPDSLDAEIDDVLDLLKGSAAPKPEPETKKQEVTKKAQEPRKETKLGNLTASEAAELFRTDPDAYARYRAEKQKTRLRR